MSDPTPKAQYAALPSRGVIRVSGPDASEFLQGLITNDVNKTSEGAIYAALLTPQGKILFDFFVLQSEGDFLLDCHGDFAPALAKRLSMYRLRAKVEITDESGRWTCFASFGEGASTRASAYRDPRLAKLGYRGIVSSELATSKPVEVAEATEEDYLAFCLDLGIGSVAMDAGQDKTFLLEANFDELNGVDFSKGCYVGQELAARMKHRARIRKRLMPVELDGDLPEPGTPIMAGPREIGSMRSGIGKRAVAMIRLDRLAEAEGTQLLSEKIPLTVHWPEWLPK